MKIILKILYDHLSNHLTWKLVAGFVAVSIPLFWINYSLDLEDGMIDKEPNNGLRFLYMFLFHGLPYLAVCALVYLSGKERSWFRNPRFWLMFFAGFTILAFDRSWSLWPLVRGQFEEQEIHFIYRVISKGKAVFTVIIPLLIFYALTEHHKPRHFYGIAIRRFNARPYFLILGIAAIIVVIAGFFGDIQEFYPRYQHSYGDRFAEYNKIPEWWAVLMYEIPYGFDFISTEFLFRGFFAIGMYRVLGPHAVLPMAMAYCIIHFGKPMTEAISSIFGGYILGVIALKHRNIWGGVIIHVGMAWMMELVGFAWRIF